MIGRQVEISNFSQTTKIPNFGSRFKIPFPNTVQQKNLFFEHAKEVKSIQNIEIHSSSSIVYQKNSINISKTAKKKKTSRLNHKLSESKEGPKVTKSLFFPNKGFSLK